MKLTNKNGQELSLKNKNKNRIKIILKKNLASTKVMDSK